MSNLRKCYTGVGSRKTPVKILSIMTSTARKLSDLRYILRSGNAYGADRAFERGAGSRKSIYLARDNTISAERIAAKFHLAWNRCNAYARALHGRNSFQVLGRNLKTPSEFLICWTPDGCTRHADRTIRTGGTGTAISIADHYGVKIFNLANLDHLDRLNSFIEGGE